MHIQSVIFDRVFSISPHHTKWGKWTEFGFESGGKKVLQASVYGHPAIPSGVKLLMALPAPDDWKNICGWANLDTGEISVQSAAVGDSIALFVIWLAFIVATFPAFLLRISELSNGQILGVSVGVVGVSLLIGYSIRRVRRLVASRKLLEDQLSVHRGS